MPYITDSTMATMTTKLEFVKLRVQMSDQTSLKENPITASTQPGSNGNNNPASSSSSLELTQTDLYNYLYNQNDVKPLSEEEILRERENPIEIFWCNLCRKESPSLCKVHGAVHCKSRSSLVTNVLSTAIKSFPNEVQLCRSSIPGTTYGVIAKCFIPKGTWLGPFEGTKVRPDNVRLGVEKPFMWEIFQGGQLAYYLDGSNEDKSSWMRFIACARHSNEQNLYAFQYCGNIYYRAFKEISPGTELLVWYDDNYPQFMGIPLEIRETEGIYQRAVDPSMKQNEVVVVVSATGNPSSHQYHDQRIEPPLPTVPGGVLPMHFPNVSKSNLPSLGTYSQAKRPSPAEILSAAAVANSVFPTQQPGYPVPKLPEASVMKRHVGLPQVPVGAHWRPGIRVSATQGFQPQFKDDNRKRMAWQQADGSSATTRFPSSGAPLQTPPSLIAESNVPTETQQRKRTLSEASETLSVPSNNQDEKDESLKESSNKENNSFKCGQCGKTFPQRSVLQIHVCPKQPYKPYHCGHCDRLFDDPNELRNHAIIHTNEKPFKCGYCSRSFSGATTLNNHIRTHTGEKPFECRVCGKTFSQASQLSRHEKIPGDCIEK